ncbi:MAG TPA: transposase [Candidatus Merdisoma merdipullorum]|nr:transposase [Candidatus Merdisoma merdipullorum]
MQQDIIPVWKRYVLTITEAAEYYHIGENKLRMIADEHPEADFIIMNGNRILIKRQKFEEFLDHATVV